MSYSFVPPFDYTALPTAMLDLVKAHCRVRHSDDDEALKLYAGQAIDLAEKVWGFRVFAANVAWIPDPAGKFSRYDLPVWPVASFAAQSASVDVSADYEIGMTSMVEPWWLAKKDGQVFPDDLTVTLATGYADPAEIPPAGLAGILRVVASLYETRESYGTVSDAMVPSWANDMLVGLWVPRA